VNAIVLITDGEPYGDNNLPQKMRDNKIQCPRTPATAPDPCGTDGSNSTPNLLDDVTNYLATTDLAKDDVTKPETIGIQDVITFVIGMGLKVPCWTMPPSTARPPRPCARTTRRTCRTR